MQNEFKEPNDLFAELEQKAKESTALDNAQRVANGGKGDMDHYPYMSGALQAAYSSLYSDYKLTLDKLEDSQRECKAFRLAIDSVQVRDTIFDLAADLKKEMA
jgi:hypothetical protein